MNILLSLNGLFWLLLALVALIFLQRILHREIQAFFLILTRRPGATQVIFALIFFPGVLLHELSHFLMAKLLGVRTGRFSLLPQAMSNGRLRLGYVETASGGVVRDALVGFAPLVTGCLFVAYAAIYPMQMLPLWSILHGGNFTLFWRGLGILPTLKDFWLWFYFTFVISSTMMPSASDRHAWLPIGVFTGALLLVAILAGAGPWMLEHIASPFNSFLNSLALIFGLSAVLHALFIIPFFFLHRPLARLTGVDIGR
jgi:hypothetical protein